MLFGKTLNELINEVQRSVGGLSSPPGGGIVLDFEHRNNSYVVWTRNFGSSQTETTFLSKRTFLKRDWFKEEEIQKKATPSSLCLQYSRIEKW